MKKLFFSIAALALAASSNAQQVTAPEPEFIGSYCMLTSDSTYVVLPKENGKVEKHQNKFSKFSKIAGAVSDLGFAGGMVGLSTGSMAGLETGVRVMGTAAGVGLAADAVNTLAGVEGMDIAFAGGKSAHSIKRTERISDCSSRLRRMIMTRWASTASCDSRLLRRTEEYSG